PGARCRDLTGGNRGRSYYGYLYHCNPLDQTLRGGCAMRKELSILIIIIFGLFLGLIALDLTFGEPDNTTMDDYFIMNGQEQAATNNIVTTIVFDYRGFDTLG